MLRLKNVKIVLTIFFVGFSGLLSLKSSIIDLDYDDKGVYFFDHALLVGNSYKYDSEEIKEKVHYIHTKLPHSARYIKKDSSNRLGITPYPEEKRTFIINNKKELEEEIIKRVFNYLKQENTNHLFRVDLFGMFFRTAVVAVLLDFKLISKDMSEKILSHLMKSVLNACDFVDNSSRESFYGEEYQECCLKKSTKHIAEKYEYDDEDLNCLKLMSEYYNKKNLLQDLKNKYEKTHKRVLSGANQLKGVYKFFTDKIDLLSARQYTRNKKQAMIRDIETIIIDELNKIDPNMVSQNSIRAKIDYLVMKRSYNIDSSDNSDDYEHAIKGEEELSKLMKNLYLNIRNTIFAKYQLKY